MIAPGRDGELASRDEVPAYADTGSELHALGEEVVGPQPASNEHDRSEMERGLGMRRYGFRSMKLEIESGSRRRKFGRVRTFCAKAQRFNVISCCWTRDTRS